MNISIITLISFIIGLSYAYFTTIVIGNDTASSNITTSGSLKLTYNGTDSISLENSQPGDSDTMSFTVTNSGSLEVLGYDIYFSKLINTFVNDELVYEISCVSSDAIPCNNKVETPVPVIESLVHNGASIAPGTTHTYTLNITFIETGSSQDYNQNKEFYLTISINAEFAFQTLVARQDYDTYELFWAYASDITSVSFESGINIPMGAVESWDVSVAGEGGIMAYVIDDGLGTNTYELHIQSNDGIILANPNSKYLFRLFSNVLEFNNLNFLRTHLVTTMYQMFYGCESIAELDTSNFDTSNVLNMDFLFEALYNVTSLNVESFDTSNVTSMRGTFSGCQSIIELDLSNFDTSNVLYMFTLFGGCYNLESLDLSLFDTSKVIDMEYMFGSCTSLTNLDLTSFNTSSLVWAEAMFSDCTNLVTINLNSFDTSNVISMHSLFSGCSALTSLDLSTFDTSKVTNMSSMFEGCSALTSLDLRIATFIIVTYNTDMFANITNGINIIVKDTAAQTFINARLTAAGKTGNVTIFV